jgi:hypothetical protein
VKLPILGDPLQHGKELRATQAYVWRIGRVRHSGKMMLFEF